MRITSRGVKLSWKKKKNKKSAFGQPEKQRRLTVMGRRERGRKW